MALDGVNDFQLQHGSSRPLCCLLALGLGVVEASKRVSNNAFQASNLVIRQGGKLLSRRFLVAPQFWQMTMKLHQPGMGNGQAATSEWLMSRTSSPINQLFSLEITRE